MAIKYIIIVEDDPFTQQFYEFLFMKTPYKIDIIEDGDIFVRKVNESKVDLILMDINLKNTTFEGKRVDGVFLSKYIKQSDKLNKIPILIVTAYQKKNGQKDFFSESLADDFILKPIVDYEVLLKKVENLIN